MVKTKARRKLPADTYHAFHDVTLADEAGSTQIDHLFVSPYGLFVVETKNYKGWIFGSAHSAQWTQTTGRYKHRFQNPLRQNHRHTMALSQLLSIDHGLIRSLVVFTGEARFKTPLPDNVCTLSHFDRYILSFREVVWSEQEVQRICQAIAAQRLRRAAPQTPRIAKTCASGRVASAAIFDSLWYLLEMHTFSVSERTFLCIWQMSGVV